MRLHLCKIRAASPEDKFNSCMHNAWRLDNNYFASLLFLDGFSSALHCILQFEQKWSQKLTRLARSEVHALRTSFSAFFYHNYCTQKFRFALIGICILWPLVFLTWLMAMLVYLVPVNNQSIDFMFDFFNSLQVC